MPREYLEKYAVASESKFQGIFLNSMADYVFQKQYLSLLLLITDAFQET